MSSIKVEQGAIDDELNLVFSMRDIKAFNLFKSGKDLSIKVGLIYEDETQDVKLINTSKDNNLAFTLITNNDFRIYNRQAHELIALESIEVNNYKELYGLLSKQDTYLHEPYIVKIFINGMDYGVFLMKQCYEEGFIEEKESVSSKENTNQDEVTNILEVLMIEDTESKIDHENKVIFINLEKNADTLQKISYGFSNYQNDIFIQCNQKDEELEWTKIEDGEEYDFQHFIYKGKLSYNYLGNREIYDLYITTGDVQILKISTEDEMGEFVRIDISEKIPCDIRIFSNMDEEYNNKIIKGKIEISGKTQNEKKNYSIKMNKKYKIDGMTKAKNWILDGNVLDISLMRKKLTYDVLRQIYESEDIKLNLPEVRYAEVILNGQYQGLYTLSNKIDEDLLNLDGFKSFEEQNDLLYKCVNVNGKFTSENLDRAIYGKEYKDFPYGLQPKSKDSDPIYGWHSGYEQKWTETSKYGQYWEPLETLIKTIVLSSQGEFNNIFTLVDRDKLIDLWILFIAQNNLNGTDTGQYIIRDGKWYFIPWDTNQVFGRDKGMNEVKHDFFSSDYLFNRCMKIDSFNKDFVDKWDAFVDSGILTVENFHNLIESNFIKIEDSLKRNYERWSIQGEKSFYDDVEYLKAWIENRIDWVDLYLHREGVYEE